MITRSDIYIFISGPLAFVSCCAITPPPMATGIHHIIGDRRPSTVDTKLEDDAARRHLPGTNSPLISPLTSSSASTESNSFSNGGDGSDNVEAMHSNGIVQDATTSTFQLSNNCIDDARPMRIVVIGAGYSGIIAGIRQA